MSDKDNSKGEGLKSESQALMDVQHALREAQFALQTMIEWAEKGDIPNAIALEMKRKKLSEIDRAFHESYNLNTRPATPLVGVDEKDIETIAKNAYEEWGKQPGKEWVCTWEELGQRHKDFDKFLIKQAITKFGSPQKESVDLEKVLEKFDNFMLKEYGNWKIGREEVKSFIRTHWPKPDARFVEVGKIEWPEKMTSHLDSAFFEKEQKWLITDREQRAFGEGANYMRTACQAAVEKAKGL